MSRRYADAIAGLAVAALSFVALAPVLLPSAPWPEAARDLLAGRGFPDTGASNLVSAIYLGYRAYDTLGETVVLLVALAGSVSLIASGREAARSAATYGSYGESPRRGPRTEIINVIAGKLAPIVLLFGTYVMLYGHSSPGGGFQGGVVLASGIIFIAVGRRSGGPGRIAPNLSAFGHRPLARLEALAFLAILGLSFPGAGAALESARVLASGLGVDVPTVSHIVAFNVAIGLKVGSGVALMCVMMLGGDEP